MVKRDAGSKKGKLLCCKGIFDWIKVNLAEIQLKKHQNVQKTHFVAKSSRSHWVNISFFFKKKMVICSNLVMSF